jgi:hypothetical protein
MESFDFYLDTKVTTWYRTPFEIEAESLEEAQKLAVKFIENGDHTEIGWHQVDDTTEGIVPEENGNEPTEELYDNSTGNVIWDNTKIN